MSGLAAVARPVPSDISSTAKAMVARMRHYPWLLAEEYLDPGSEAGLGVVTLDPLAGGALSTDHASGVTVALHGELFAGAGGRRGAIASGAAFLLEGWRREGSDFLARLDGEFAAVIWDPRRREMHVVTDRLGLRPLYVARPAGAFAAASEIKSLLVVPGIDTSWSETGVAQFFSSGTSSTTTRC
jgi:asparagine synthetase B (glutamine-hydrolysing)